MQPISSEDNLLGAPETNGSACKLPSESDSDFEPFDSASSHYQAQHSNVHQDEGGLEVVTAADHVETDESESDVGLASGIDCSSLY